MNTGYIRFTTETQRRNLRNYLFLNAKTRKSPFRFISVLSFDLCDLCVSVVSFFPFATAGPENGLGHSVVKIIFL